MNRASSGLASVGGLGASDDCDVSTDDIDDEVSVAEDDEREDESDFKEEDQEAALRQSHRRILVSKVDSVEWRLELERVGNR